VAVDQLEQWRDVIVRVVARGSRRRRRRRRRFKVALHLEQLGFGDGAAAALDGLHPRIFLIKIIGKRQQQQLWLPAMAETKVWQW
jgi:hypothetical protein